MTNCHDDLIDFYMQKVKLGQDELDGLRTARETCGTSVEKGLLEKEDLKPEEFISQGSFAMKTVVQHPDNDYDIDYGVLFEKENIVGSRGGDKTPRAARQMVADSFEDGRFKEKPIVKKNCVRFLYSEGYHVDMPVYRRVKTIFGPRIEIASGDEWKESDPKAVTAWFEKAVKERSPDGQMRRIVCLLKAVAKTRESYRWPSGFIVSVLVKENYVSAQRDDISFVKTLRAIVSRCNAYQTVDHPVVRGEKLAEANDSRVVWMRAKLVDFEAKFKTLEADCARGEAAKFWDQIFGVDFFTKRIVEKAASKGIAAGGAFAPGFQRPRDAGRWG